MPSEPYDGVTNAQEDQTPRVHTFGPEWYMALSDEDRFAVHDFLEAALPDLFYDGEIQLAKVVSIEVRLLPEDQYERII